MAQAPKFLESNIITILFDLYVVTQHASVRMSMCPSKLKHLPALLYTYVIHQPIPLLLTYYKQHQQLGHGSGVYLPSQQVHKMLLINSLVDM